MYSPPYNVEELKKHHPDKIEWLLKDPAHLWRAETGIELIHEEPDLEEQKRIWLNWNEMTDEMKKKSDEKSFELFGKDNFTHHQEIISNKKINHNFMEPKLFTATKAFIVHNGKILILKESVQYKDGANVGKYDVVGGRVKPGQRFDESLLREVNEETGLKVKIGRPFFVNEWRPVVKGEQWQIIGTFFECFTDSDQVVLSKDHENFQWIDPVDYKKYNLIENLIPAFESYLSR